MPVDLPLRSGDEGEPVRDLQRRLAELGLDTVGDPHGRFGDATEAAVRTFQDRRRLPVDGICGPLTWNALVEAGYRLGDRLLSLRGPMMRGDDVGELQRRLGDLGFDAGRVDAIFGPDTKQALEDFQRNVGITCDGVFGPDSLAALRRLGAKADSGTEDALRGGIAALREREELRCAPRTLAGRRIAVGHTGGLDVLASAVGRALADAGAFVLALQHPDESAQAAEANEAGAELYLGVATVAETTGTTCTAAHYAGHGYESPGGRRLAELIDEALSPVLGTDGCTARGMNLPILRETRMPAVVCRLGPPSLVVQRSSDIARAVATAVSGWVETPVDR